MKDIVIVGAGPVGLSLALGLARTGYSILVLEKQAELSKESRAPAIWPKTQEILANLGIIQSFLDEAILIDKLRIWDVDRKKDLITFQLDQLKDETDFPQLMIIPQTKTEQLLYREVQKFPNVELRFSAELTNALEAGEKVKLSYLSKDTHHSLEAKYLLGCDGIHSKVRDILGFHLSGFTYSSQVALVEFRLKKDNDYSFPRLSTANGIAVGIKIADDIWRLILPLTDDQQKNLDKRIKTSIECLFRQSDFEIIWQSKFALHNRLSSGFVKGRIALAGDAAHVNSPVGGQGMNAGIQDSLVLCQAIQAAMKDDNPLALKSYEKVRMKALKQNVLPFTNALTRLLLGGKGRYLRAVMRLAATANRIPSVQHYTLKRLAMLDIS